MQSVQNNNQLIANFTVSEERNVFKKNIHLERFLKICKVAWEIFSFIVFPIKITRFIVGSLIPLLIVPATLTFSLEENEKNKAKLILLEKDLQSKDWALENCWGGVGCEDQSKGKARKKLENEAKVLRKKVWELKSKIERVESLLAGRESFIQDRSNNAHQVKVTTADGVEIDTMMIQNDHQINLPTHEQKWIVFFHGNDMCYEESLNDFKELSKRTGASVYTGNYRGVMSSKGSPSSSHDLVLDGEAMVQKLLAAGVPSENILLHGWSIGGGVAAEVATHHQEAGHEMHLCSDRSFSTLMNVIKAFIPTFGGLLGKIAWLAGWRFNSIDNLKKINGSKILIVSKEDNIIQYEGASLYKAVKNQELQVEEKIKLPYPHGHPLVHTMLFNKYAVTVKEVLKVHTEKLSSEF